MKKIILFILALVLLSAIGISAFACNTPDKQTASVGGEDLPTTLEEAQARMEAAGYEVDYEGEEAPDYGEDGYLGYFSASKGDYDFDAYYDRYEFDDYSELFGELYESEAAAKSRFSDRDMKEEFEQEASFLRGTGKNVVVAQIGRWVLYATDDALTALKTPIASD